MKRCIAMILFSAFLLSGCTDIRERRLPDLLAVDTGSPVRFAAHSTQDDSVITAAADTALQMPEALQNTDGTEISTGHLTMLAVSGDPCAVIESYLQAQYLAPTCKVLSVQCSACAMLKNGVMPAPAELQAAVDTGMLPCRTADTVIGDLWGGSGITALPVLENGSLRLQLADRQQSYSVLSEDACRGLALLGARWKRFAFTADGTCFRLKSSRLFIKTSQEHEKLQITVSGSLITEPQLNAAAAARLTDMLRAAIEETAIQNGADVLFLLETALRDGSADGAQSQADWRMQLRSAECRIMLPSLAQSGAAGAAGLAVPAQPPPEPD